MKEHAERVDLHHVPESRPGILGLVESRGQRAQRADQRNAAEGLGTLPFVDQRIYQHDEHAKNRQHDFRQDGNVVGGMGHNLRHLWNLVHWPTTLLASSVNGASAACTAGSMAFSQISGATPITNAA